MAETNTNNEDDTTEADLALPLDSSELPFLVTNWLSSFASANPNVDSRVRHAAAELASAFSDAGVFGTAPQQSLSNRRSNAISTAQRNATFSDMRRRWGSSCPPDQLELLMGATAASNHSADSAQRSPSNLLALGSETRAERIRNPSSGRTLHDAIDVENVQGSSGSSSQSTRVSSVLQQPVLLASKQSALTSAMSTTEEESEFKPTSSFDVTVKHATSMARDFLKLKDECRSRKDQLRRLNVSLTNQQSSLSLLEQQRCGIPPTPDNNTSTGIENAQLRAQQELEEKVNNCKRVIAQLKRQISSITEQDKEKSTELQTLQARAHSAHGAFLNTVGNYRDPFAKGEAPVTSNRMLYNFTARQMGLGPVGSFQHKAPRGMLASALSTIDIRKKLVRGGFSHGATINTHFSYPIYCLRFDRSGAYFITGSDDYLAKLYCLGEHTRAKHNIVDRSDFIAGAVLVCTLRGHAGVINDINVSCDNAFLATASEDGDCRVWGLNDGTPIAILRGHAGGANMVVWSSLTPYRLVTAASDGFARVWDIKQAAMKRYKRIIGDRNDYGRKAEQSEGKEDESNSSSSDEMAEPATPRQEGDAASNPLPLPPLPPGADVAQPPGAGADMPQPPNVPPGPDDENEPGRFVAGNTIDRGVRVLDKLLHGASQGESFSGPGTRSRRSSVKVLCVAFCPSGGHFTTGADDGMGRMYSTNEDREVEITDCHAMSESGISVGRHRPRRGASSRLLKVLTGHLSPITDLQYAYAGDRILTASQKDGVVRIWSWNIDPACVDAAASSLASSPVSGGSNFSNIVIKMTNPNSKKKTRVEQQDGRRRPTRSSSTDVSCDAASWVRDDEFIVTSQCEIAKQSTNEIVPGSQYIFVWGSHTGHCLLGINGAHTMPCAVVLAHSIDPRMVVSAGADGKACMWDLESGRCLFSHQNTVDFGPGDALDRGQKSAFLDGSFSPDGTHLVLTDDAGRVITLNCLESTNPIDQPAWTQEQYFANDYYELVYDPDGYCIEKGSERPPHLAPKGVRCRHSGASSGEKVNKAFRMLSGPLPLAEHHVRWERIKLRMKMENPPSRRVARGNIVGQYEPGVTRVISASGKPLTGRPAEEEAVTVPRAEAPSVQTSRQLSRNYRWSDFNDILQEERWAQQDEEAPADSDDDSFHIESNRTRRSSNGNRSGRGSGNRRSQLPAEESDDDSEMVLDDSPAPRATSRGTSRRRYNDGESSSDEEIIEMMSSNNTPSGPFKADYDSHYFRIQHNWHINIAWLRRDEGLSSYDGRKKYAPQAGDEVVYIPRAHHETISEFPTLLPPWQHWPDDVEWPVVRCLIKNIRYRFPYTSYFPRRNDSQSVCKSVVAILTLELTGIPQLSDDEYWPKATFINPTRKHLFEVSMFESDNTDFVVPLSLYTARIQSLDDALLQCENPDVEAFYSRNTMDEDCMLEPYMGKVYVRTDGDSLNAPNLRGSGYHCISVEWPDMTRDNFCPWEVQTKHMKAIPRPRLSDEEKTVVRKALRTIREMDTSQSFLKPVNVMRYSDYETRVEIPMDLEFVTTRLEANYYSNMLSVLSDIKLIRDNSDKYNGEHGDLTILGTEMLKKFAQEVLSAEELADFNSFQQKLQSDALAGTVGQYEEQDRPESLEPTVRRVRLSMRQNDSSSLRRSQRTRVPVSALERLPPPQPERHLRIRVRVPPAAQQPQQPPAVSLDAGTRGRTTRNSRGQAPSTRQLRSNSGGRTDGLGTARVTRNSSSQPRDPAPSRRQLRSSGFPEDGDPTFPAEPTGRTTRTSRNSVTSSLASVARASSGSRSRGPSRAALDESDHSDHTDHSDHDSESEAPRSGRAAPVARRASARIGLGHNRRTTRSQLESIGGDTENESLSDEEEEEEHEMPERAKRRRPADDSDLSDYDENSGDSEDIDDEDDVRPPRRRRPTRRQPRKSASMGRRQSTGSNSLEDSFEEDSDGSNHSESAPEPSTPKIRRSSRLTQDSLAGGSETPGKRRSFRLSQETPSGPGNETPATRRSSRLYRGGDNENTLSQQGRLRADSQETDGGRSESEESDNQHTEDEEDSKKEQLDSDTSGDVHGFGTRSRRSGRVPNSKKEQSDSDTSGDVHGFATRSRRSSRVPNSKKEQSDSDTSGDVHGFATRSRRSSRVPNSKKEQSDSDTSGDVHGFATRGSHSSRVPNSKKEQSDSDTSGDVHGFVDRRSTRAPNDEPRSGRRAASRVQSYAVPSSDFDSESDAEARPKSTPRKRKAPPAKSQKKKQPAKRQRTKRNAFDQIPSMKEWPDVELKDITTITMTILERLREQDTGEAFARPVDEEFPDIWPEYAKVVANPMDFRTIEEERLPGYRRIEDLREDLCLVFRNCILFNPDRRTPLNKLATSCLVGLEDTFREVCKELNILLPRRW